MKNKIDIDLFYLGKLKNKINKGPNFLNFRYKPKFIPIGNWTAQILVTEYNEMNQFTETTAHFTINEIKQNTKLIILLCMLKHRCGFDIIGNVPGMLQQL